MIFSSPHKPPDPLIWFGDNLKRIRPKTTHPLIFFFFSFESFHTVETNFLSFHHRVRGYLNPYMAWVASQPRVLKDFTL